MVKGMGTSICRWHIKLQQSLLKMQLLQSIMTYSFKCACGMARDGSSIGHCSLMVVCI